MYIQHDPLITKKIFFIKNLLKTSAKAGRENKKIIKDNNKIILKESIEKKCSWYKAFFNVQDKLTKPHNVNYYLTQLHIYYLKLKGSNKQHTKDDKRYENSIEYKIALEKLEKEFQLSQEVG